LRDGWHYGISEGSKLVHVMGNPISQATHWGFNRPLLRSWSRTESRKRVCRFWSEDGWLRGLVSSLFGVGHVRRPTTVSRFGNLAGLCADSGVMIADIAVFALGVGHEEDAITSVRGTNGGC